MSLLNRDPEVLQTEPNQQDVRIHVDVGRESRIKKWAVRGAALVALSGVAVAALDRYTDFELFSGVDMPEIGMPNIVNEPPRARAFVMHETYEMEAELNIACMAQVSVGVSVNGVKDELAGNGRLDKVLFGDFLLCGDTGSISADAVFVRDERTNEIEAITVSTLGLMVTHPRVDHTDPRNCAPLRVGDSIEEIEDKISEYDPEEENCDDGFEVEGAFWGRGPGLGGDDLANVISTGNTATQIAMAADAEPLEIIEEQNARFIETLREKVAATYQVPIEIVEVELLGSEERFRYRMEAIVDDLTASGYELEFDEEDNEMIVHRNNGGRVTVGISSIDVTDININRIMQSAEQRIVDTPEGVR